MFHAPIVAGDGDTPSPIRLRVLSLGAGVQSTTLALLAAQGVVGPMPDCAIFADTGWEPASVYAHLRWLMSPNVLPFPVHIVSAGNIRDNLLDASRSERWASIPAFTRTIRRGGRIEVGMIRRQCTGDYKIVPIRRKVRELLGLTRKRSPQFPVAEQWIGISTDEAIRMKPSFEPWQVNRWPLIEQRMSRQDCLAWLRRHDYPTPPKSSCVGCPFHSNAAWRRIRDHDPDAWDDAVAIDRAIRTGLRGIRGEVYLHRSAVPLDEADLSTEADLAALRRAAGPLPGGAPPMAVFVFPVLARERGYRWVVSYQDAALHSGNLYRFDGWVRLGRSRSGVDLRTGRKGRNKVIWGWPARPCQPEDASACTVTALLASVFVTGSGAGGPFGIGR